MKACVFLGPSLSTDEAARCLPEAEFLPPVQAGDVRAALHRGATHIGIIDGFFEQVATVWHKEILFALSRGAWVYGGASMGALRAAELHRYGVIGVGEVFAAYRSGRFEDDDEVAVNHAAAEAGFRELSSAMANIRFGLAQACERGILSQRAADALVGAAKRRFYAERSWKALFVDGRSLVEVDDAELQALEAWVAQARPNQKRDDALLLLRRMAADLTREDEPFRADFSFEPTGHWNRAERAFRRRLDGPAEHPPGDDGGAAPTSPESVRGPLARPAAGD